MCFSVIIHWWIMKDNFITEAFVFTLANTWNKKHQSYFPVNSFICIPSEHCGIQRTILFFLITRRKKKTFYQTGHGLSVLLQCTCMLGSLCTMLIKGQVINVSFLFFEKILQSWNKPQPWTGNESIGLFEAILFFIAVAFARWNFLLFSNPKPIKNIQRANASVIPLIRVCCKSESTQRLVEDGMSTGLTNAHTARGFSVLYHLFARKQCILRSALHYLMLHRFEIHSAASHPRVFVRRLVGNNQLTSWYYFN